ncbi:MAG: ATP-dependent zinc metalloprotease FtsH [Muribaculaceae bacterium]|nr:ATP-dependent zinc metalloprotease FtsH [Muribaculaceae bacterium]
MLPGFNTPRPNNNQNKRPVNRRPHLNMLWLYVLICIALIALYKFQDNSIIKEVSIDKFTEYAKKGYIEEVTLNRESAEVIGLLTRQGAKDLKLDGGRTDVDAKVEAQATSAEKYEEQIESINQDLKADGKEPITINVHNGSDLMKVLWYFGPILLFVLLMYFLSRRMSGGGGGGGIFSVGKSKAKVFDKNSGSNVTFKDVAGLAEAKVEIEEIVEFLKNPQRYTELGAKIPRGALLVGPPGTGKTLLAKAVAGEANVPFLSMSGSDFVEMFVGVGAARVRDLFKQAKEKAPCIVFIDEIDAVGRARGKNPSMGSNDERENTLNQMLTEMDGFGSNNGVIILAATNRADMLDKALMRPGRFDRQIYVDLPELTDRIEILNVHLRNIKVNSSLDVEAIARQTSGFSGADLANVCNEAALIAARNNAESVDMEDFRKAIDRIVGGLEKKSIVYTDEEKNAIATHEAGHATVDWLIEYGNPLVKVTIVPHNRAAGYAMYAPEDRYYHPIQYLLDRICGLLGGRAAEEVFTGVIGTGASNDMERATQIAISIVMVYGASDKLKNINYSDSTGQAYGYHKPYSDATAKIIDEEVARIINEQYERAKEILRKYATQHNKIRDMLIEREVIYHDDVESVLGPRPWKSNTDMVLERHHQKLLEQGEASQANGTLAESQVSGNDTPKLSNGEANDSGTTPQSESTSDEDPGTPPPFKK